MDEIVMLNETLDVFDRGYYEKCGHNVSLDAQPKKYSTAQVLLPDDVERMSNDPTFHPAPRPGHRCQYRCENRESFEMAMDWPEGFDSSAAKVLVLNFANPANPGGGVRRGARAQEEDLCRKSSLLLSLESDQARSYYAYNRSLGTRLGSNAIVISPSVAIIRFASGELLDEPYRCAVMTCAAPMVSFGLEGLDELEYVQLLRNRVDGMLRCAARLGYRRLVLGAWGCGAFGNDARVVSDVFYRALKELDYNGRGQDDLFDSIDFAVRSRSRDHYNLRQFQRHFMQANC